MRVLKRLRWKILTHAHARRIRTRTHIIRGVATPQPDPAAYPLFIFSHSSYHKQIYTHSLPRSCPNGPTHRYHTETAKRSRAQPRFRFHPPRKEPRERGHESNPPGELRISFVSKRLAQLSAKGAREGRREREIGRVKQGRQERIKTTPDENAEQWIAKTPSGKKRHLIRYVSAR